MELKRIEDAFYGIELYHSAGEILEKTKQMDLFMKYIVSYIDDLPVKNFRNRNDFKIEKYKLLYNMVTYVLKYHDDDCHLN